MRPFTFPGEFPDCGCHYNDDGIHFCLLHRAAADMLAACETARGFCVYVRQTDPQWAEHQEVGKLYAILSEVIRKAKLVPEQDQ